MATWNREAILAWQPAADFQLPEGMGYEVVVWDVDEEPLDSSQAFGIHAIVTNERIKIDGKQVLEQSNSVVESDVTYQWGVVLTQIAPYKRLVLMSPHNCRFKIGSKVK